MVNYLEIKDYIAKEKFIDFEKSFELSSLCSKLLRNKAAEFTGRDLVIRMLDAWQQKRVEPKTFTVWNDLVEAAGLYPYTNCSHLKGSASIRFEFHKSPYLKDVYFHEEQLDISLNLMSGKAVVLSAPTSFGKSLLIEEVVASNKYSNIVIIQPTLALLDETRKKLGKYRDKYDLIVSTSQTPTRLTGNIFLFTGERVVEYNNFPKIDFFVIDEFYKLSLQREDDRAIALNQAFHKLSKLTDRFYMLGPQVKEIPTELKKAFAVSWVHTNFRTVAIDEIPVTTRQINKIDQRQPILYKLLQALNEPTLIYCASPQTATRLAEEFLPYLKSHSSGIETEKNDDMIGWIEENIHPSWVLGKSLKKLTAFHHGALPRHLGSSIVDAFNKGSIKFLFCTSTLIEGVNTTAKNIVLFDRKKGIKPIDFFDYQNIAGRSGRMKRHFIGKVFKFFEEPEQREFKLDIPILTQENAPIEVLIQLDSSELKASVASRMAEFFKLSPEEQQLFRNNVGLPLDGQIKAIKTIESQLKRYSGLLSWNTYPSYQELLPVVELAWNFLLKPGESRGGVLSAAQLAATTIKYCRLKTIRGLIESDLDSDFWKNREPDTNKRISKVVFQNLNIYRHWFQYKLPKFLRTISLLQRHVFTKKGIQYGDYGFLASQIESGFLPASLSVLLEYDIPLSAAQKLRKHFKDLGFSDLVKKLATADLKAYGLNKYEIEKIRSSIS